MFAFFSRRFAEIKDCFSLVSTMIGIFGLGHFVLSEVVGDFEKMSSILFFIVGCFVFLFLIFHSF